MNYLAHSMISLELDKKLTKDRSTLYGNFTGDFYKGKIEKINLPENLKEGVVLHRIIDSISDRENNYLNDILSKDFGIFKGIVSDIVIDHFISKNFYSIFNENINDIEKKILYTIHDNKRYFPLKFYDSFDWVVKNKAMSNYSNLDFLEIVFIGMSKRIRKGEILLLAIKKISENYKIFEENSINEFLYVKEHSINKFLNK
ncbi:MAG: DUF479 domain-containing protein [Leptotrichiaceae bacterium]|nr:DUF479 domain-containing protein [Leptotrichiaceae bacterium]MBP6280880.1 DUF479 domain-containing protein [Leptotrichiaceae bacterium]MBP7100223.1 DUF479 domain-containing protein [Leptotrichiaceae bacterium]MBP7739586.1 DUF479 domain-containing protein [Leptotrichiaceae bacterium]MBP9629945.1 DUF479 domain-containing protein [Leptotrichiaceae bacterium]